MPTRTAHCLCGQLSVTLTGEPFAVLLCSCTDCQRRTGSTYGVGAYFHGPQVLAQTGAARRFTKIADSGRPVQFHFCPNCGTSLYWTVPDAPLSEGLGVAVGCFGDPRFPQPTLATWYDSRIDWTALPEGVPRMARQPDQLPGLPD